MLRGTSITLRPIRDTDLEELYAFHVDIKNRGEFYPRDVQSQPAFTKQFHDAGFWSNNHGLLLIINDAGETIGQIEYFTTVAYLSEYELSYMVYKPEHRGQGVVTEAVNLLVRYLFETKNINRIRLIIHPDNVASRRLAEKCQFRHEGTARGAWYNNGKYHDVEVYAILHDDVIGA